MTSALRTRLHRWLVSLRAARPGVGFLFGLALLPGLLSGAILSYAIYDNERARLEQNALQTARALRQTIDSELSRAQAAALALSTSERLTANDFPAFHREARETLRATGIGHNYVLSTLDGQLVLDTALPYPGSGTLPRHGSPAQLQQVRRTLRPAISDLYRAPRLQTLAFSVDVPVLVNGRLAYVLSLGMSPEHFNRLLLEQKLPAGWIAALLDASKTVAARNLNPEQAVGKRATPDLQARMRQSDEGSMASRTLEGTPSFVAFSRSPHSQWTIAVGMTRDVLHTNLYRPLALAGLSMLAFLAGGIFLAWLFSRYVRQALKALGTATEAAAMGDRNARAPRSGLLEISRLADQLNLAQDARTLAEERLHASERELNEAQRIAHLGSWHLSLSGHQSVWSKTMYDMFGYDPASPPPSYQESKALFTAESWARLTTALQHTRKTGEACELEVNTVRRDGQSGWALVRSEVLRNRDGEIVALRGVAQDITERKRLEDQIRNLAYFDSLTNLPNRRMLLDRLSVALSQAKRYRRSLAVMFLDLDHFKSINDTQGHDTGDQLLREVAGRLCRSVRAGDTVARLGGDEFIVLLPEISHPADAENVAIKVIEAINQPVICGALSLRISTSIGITVLPPDGDADDAADLLKRADRAMYDAKQAGRNAYRFAAD